MVMPSVEFDEDFDGCEDDADAGTDGSRSPANVKLKGCETQATPRPSRRSCASRPATKR
jgi:hypothetical protein